MCISLIDLSTSRNIEQTPPEYWNMEQPFYTTTPTKKKKKQVGQQWITVALQKYLNNSNCS
jgi:hypothetical protein